MLLSSNCIKSLCASLFHNYTLDNSGEKSTKGIQEQGTLFPVYVLNTLPCHSITVEEGRASNSKWCSLFSVILSPAVCADVNAEVTCQISFVHL